VTAERNVLLVDANTLKVIKTLPLNFECRIAGNDASHVYLFGVKGGMYSVDFQLSKVTSEKLPFSQPVTTCNFNIENGDKAFGTSDGTIYYFEPSGQMHRLVGHRSRISRVRFENDLLFSTSYDGTVKFWNTSYDKIEPITVMNTNQWIGTFTVSKDKEHIWTGDQNGNLNYTTISVELMADKVLANLKRNFTQEEWEYYIGNQIPFETFINKGK
jgi:WD40 repeat protein